MQAGHESTASLIGNMVMNLLSHPEQLALVTGEPDRISAAVDETLRFTSPTQFLFRKPYRDVDIAGTRIPAGEVICALIGSANRDDRAFERGDEFDITRKNMPTLAFGVGAHFCIGAQLARMEAAAALRKLLSHLREYRLGEVRRVPNMIAYGHDRIQLLRVC